MLVIWQIVLIYLRFKVTFLNCINCLQKKSLKTWFFFIQTFYHRRWNNGRNTAVSFNLLFLVICIFFYQKVHYTSMITCWFQFCLCTWQNGKTITARWMMMTEYNTNNSTTALSEQTKQTKMCNMGRHLFNDH